MYILIKTFSKMSVTQIKKNTERAIFKINKDSKLYVQML